MLFATMNALTDDFDETYKTVDWHDLDQGWKVSRKIFRHRHGTAHFKLRAAGTARHKISERLCLARHGTARHAFEKKIQILSFIAFL